MFNIIKATFSAFLRELIKDVKILKSFHFNKYIPTLLNPAHAFDTTP